MTEDTRIIWGANSSARPTIELGQPYTVKDEKYQKYWLDRLGFPTDLTGKRILEGFSGGSAHSFRHAIEERGGRYVSIDSDPDDTNGPNHITGDIFDEVPRLVRDGEKFDFVVMKYPPIWGKQFEEGGLGNLGKLKRGNDHGLKDYPQLEDLLVQMTNLIHPIRGNSINILGGCSQDDINVLYNSLPKRIGNDWLISSQLSHRAETKPKRTWTGKIIRKPNRVPEMELQDEYQLQILRK